MRRAGASSHARCAAVSGPNLAVEIELTLQQPYFHAYLLRIDGEPVALETPVAITFLPGESMDARIAAAADVRALGLEPMPHLSARRIHSHEELAETVSRTVAEAGARRMFLVAGDPAVPAGPFEDTMALLRTGLFEANGIQAIGIAGHPEGHPAMDEQGCWDALETKHAEITRRDMATLIVTQFGFDWRDRRTSLVTYDGLNASVRPTTVSAATTE